MNKETSEVFYMCVKAQTNSLAPFMFVICQSTLKHPKSLSMHSLAHPQNDDEDMTTGIANSKDRFASAKLTRSGWSRMSITGPV